ncbi:hypothetical protein B0T22DRAFT_491659 [Podospora appendiculata]|uniref:Uncharacterized protein n=1 Tax=Podospora appendiculata TaxID=314037 RepID=A0AAE1CED5_9PEZI|nr:hypothetical protein B0T22DRAFT_491659 [Podospora appendiculata]
MTNPYGPAPITAMPKPPDPELDKIFCTERYQQQENCGIRSWELGTMNHALPSSGDPQDPSFCELEVREETWCTAFSELRWFDLVPSDAYREHWTVDDDELWAELRVVIELANRIFWNHLSSSEWFQALLHGPLTKMPGERLNKDFSEHIWKMETNVFDEDDNWGEEIKALWDELQVLGFSVVWTFFDPEDPEHYGTLPEDPSPFAYTSLNKMRSKEGGKITHLASCHLSVGLVRRLLVNPTTRLDPTIFEPGLNMAEKHNARVHLAKAHAVNLLLGVHKFSDEMFDEVKKIEPFYRDERVTELGFSSDLALWGGVLSISYPTTVHEDDGPDAKPRHQQDPVIVTWRPLPIFWAASLQNELYWEGPWARYGSSSIYPDDFMATDVRYSKNASHNRVYHARMENAHEFFGEGLQGSYERTIDCMRHRQSQWRFMRPWYDREYRIWQSTPYSLINLRTAVEKFTKAAAQKDIDLETESPLYIFIVLEQMMIAAAPWLPRPVEYRAAKERLALRNRWKASATAQQIMRPEDRFFFINDFGPCQEKAEFVGGTTPILFASRGIHITGLPEAADQARRILLDYLNPEQMYLIEPGRRWPVPKALYVAMRAQLRSLLQQAWGPEGNNTWLDFTFTFPDYNASDFVILPSRQDAADNGRFHAIQHESAPAPAFPPEVYQPSPEPAQSDFLRGSALPST